MASLSDLMKQGGGPAPAPDKPAEAAPDLFPVRKTVEVEIQQERAVPMPSPSFAGVEIEAVICGALMRVAFGPGTNPAIVPGILRGLDPGTKFRDDFPKGGFGAGGKKNTKAGRALVVTMECRGEYRNVAITAQCGDDDVSVSVGKRQIDEFPAKLAALGKLGEKSLGKLVSAFDAKKSATVVLGEAEQFGVLYVDLDGKCFLEEMQAEPPKQEA